MKAAIGIKDSNSLAVANDLAKLLADENVLYIKTKNAHWNVEGSDFYNKHKFFETQFVELDAIIDKVAERIRSVGHYAPGTLKSFLELTHLTESTESKNDSEGFLKELLMDHESIIIYCREHIRRFVNDYSDAGSADFITGIMEDHEKMAWFIRSHII